MNRATHAHRTRSRKLWLRAGLYGGSPLMRGYVLKTARKPRIAYSQNYPRKHLKSPIKYIRFSIPRNIYIYIVTDLLKALLGGRPMGAF
jgi:hypothetical protein